MIKDGTRSMAWVVKIDDVVKHPNADSLSICSIGGWKCVSKLDEFKRGDLAIYCSIDSWMPHDLAPFLSKGKEPREFNGVKGERLRTIRLRGELSQGMLMSGIICPTGLMVTRPDSMAHIFQEGDDVSVWLGIQKWEAPVPAQLVGQVRGLFPNFIPKTDQERIQNLTKELQEWNEQGECWNITEKLDGSSMTVYIHYGEVGVCSRNLDLKEDDNNSFWRVAKAEGLLETLKEVYHEWGANIALQGELIGEGIQKNPYKLKGQQFRLFDVYDIDRERYWTLSEKKNFCARYGIVHVPIINEGMPLKHSMQELLDMANTRSVMNPNTIQEGYVFVNNSKPALSFKVISNDWLLKNE